MGALQYATNYDPYGNPFETSGSLTSSLGYTGEFTDPNGLLYLRARYMQPGYGTFLSKDPFEGVMQRVMSRNGYSYVEGNPVNYADPSGKTPWFIWAAPGIAFTGAVASVDFAWDYYMLAYAGLCGCIMTQWAHGMDFGARLAYFGQAATSGAAHATVGLATAAISELSPALGTALNLASAADSVRVLYEIFTREGAAERGVCTLMESVLGIEGLLSNVLRLQASLERANETSTSSPPTPDEQMIEPLDLSPQDAASFRSGVFTLRRFGAGERLYRVPNNLNESIDSPGAYFGLEDTHSMALYESMYNVAQYDNSLAVVRVYAFKEPVTAYVGMVEGGTGTQVLIPRSIEPSSVLQFVSEHPLIAPTGP